MGNPQQQEKPKETRRDFGDMPDIEDLMFMAEVDDADVEQAVLWLEDKAPKIADKVSKE